MTTGTAGRETISTMQAMGIDAFGGPEALSLREVPLPTPGPGEVRVRVRRAGVNYIDVYMRNGTYARSHTYRTPLPMVLGMEGSGEVDALGEGVRGPAPGARVAWCLCRGAYAGFAIVPAWKLVAVPDVIDDDVACALMLQGSTAHYLTHSAYPLAAGHACLVHAGAGGVGQILIQLAKARGATVITTVGSDDKAAIAAALGADHVIRYRDVDFAPVVRELTKGRGVDVVYDSVGRDTLARSLAVLRRRGLCVLFGASSGPVESITPIALAEAGSVFFTRPHLADYLADAGEIGRRAADLFGAVAAGHLRVAIDRTLPLARAADAHRALEARESRGKLLLAID
jgi:NADPH2:quinone reductase